MATTSAAAANPPAEIIELTYGPLVTGIWIQQLLFGYILAQMVDYYRMQWKADSVLNRTIVTTLLVLNTVLGGTDFHVLYRCSVLFYGQYEFFDLQEWTMFMEPGWTAIVGFVAQIFFLVRCHRIAKNKAVTGILTLLVLFALGAGLAVSGSFFHYKNFSLLPKFTLPIILWLVSTAVADIALAGALSWYLMLSRTRFKKTDAIITKIVMIAMETSSLTALIAFLNLVLFLPLQDTAYHLLPQFSMSRVYTISVMVTLLARTEFRDVLMASENNTIPTSIFRSTQRRTRGRGSHDDIRVDVSTMIHREGDVEAAAGTAVKPEFIDLEERVDHDTKGGMSSRSQTGSYN